MGKHGYWIADGSVRGSCGHRHRTERGAAKCAERDNRDVQRGHGRTAYSDRRPVFVAGAR